jgi:hypothetical protein
VGIRHCLATALLAQVAWATPSIAGAPYFRLTNGPIQGAGDVVSLPPANGVNGVGDLQVSGPTAIRVPGTTGVSYPLTVNGPSQGVTWTSVGNPLPPGLTLNSAGAIVGKATEPGTYTGIVGKATDASGKTAVTQPFQIVVGEVTVALEPDVPVLKARVGDALSLQGRAAGLMGQPSWSYVLSQGDIPGGLGFHPENGSLLGSAMTPGDATIKIEARDVDGTVGASKAVAVKVAPALSLSGIAPVYATRVGRSFATGTPVASGLVGAPTLTLDVPPPAGTTFDGSVLSGASATPLDTQATVTLKDGWDGETASAGFRLAVVPPLSVGPMANVSLRSGIAVPASAPRPSAGNLLPGGTLRWDLAAGGLPDGVLVEPTTGRLTGTPSAVATTSTYPQLRLSATDSDGTSESTAPFAVTVNPPPTVTGIQAGGYQAVEGETFEAQLSASNVFGTASWTAAGLPPGVGVDGTGKVSGRVGSSPAGTYAGRISLRDGADQSEGTADFPVTVAARALPALSAGYTLINQGRDETRGTCTNLTVTNGGSLPVQSVSYSVSPAADFATCTGQAASGVPACSGTIPANGSCNIGVQMKATTDGVKSGTLTLTSANGIPSTLTATLGGSYYGPEATAANTYPTSDSPGSSYVYASNQGGTFVERFYDNDIYTGVGVTRNGYTGVVFPKAVKINGLSLALSVGSYQFSQYRNTWIEYQVHYLDENGNWQYLPTQTLSTDGAVGLPGGQSVTVNIGSIKASDIRVRTNFDSSVVMAAGVMTFRPLYQ